MPRSLRTAAASVLLIGLAACASRPQPAAAPTAPALPASTALSPQEALSRDLVSSLDWEQDMRRFAAEDAAAAPPREAVLFVGSSSIRLWKTLAGDFGTVPVINRGFGGSQVRDSRYYADRIVVPYAPRLVVFYAGDNDLNAGRSPQQVADDFSAFVARVRQDLPEVPIVYVAIKPSPSRAALLPHIRAANTLIRRRAEALDDVGYADVFTPMLDASGQPRGELFIEDRLHMNAVGYALWRKVLMPYVLQ